MTTELIKQSLCCDTAVNNRKLVNVNTYIHNKQFHYFNTVCSANNLGEKWALSLVYS